MSDGMYCGCVVGPDSVVPSQSCPLHGWRKQSPPGGTPNRPPAVPERMVRDAALLEKHTRPAPEEPDTGPDPDYAAASRSERRQAIMERRGPFPASMVVASTPAAPAAEAAQSPQVGAAPRVEEFIAAAKDALMDSEYPRDPADWPWSIRLLGQDRRACYRQRDEARAALESIERNEPNGIAIVARALAHTGRSVSDRPPAPVASADPELAELIAQTVNFLRTSCASNTAWRLADRLDSALSRLAGQAATAEIAKDSGGAARGLPEENGD